MSDVRSVTTAEVNRFRLATRYRILTPVPHSTRPHDGAGLKIEKKHLEELHKVQEDGSHIWIWAWVCLEGCYSIFPAPCPDRVEADDAAFADPALMRRWLAHLRDHGWREEDFDPAWRSRATGHHRWESWMSRKPGQPRRFL